MPAYDIGHWGPMGQRGTGPVSARAASDLTDVESWQIWIMDRDHHPRKSYASLVELNQDLAQVISDWKDCYGGG